MKSKYIIIKKKQKKKKWCKIFFYTRIKLNYLLNVFFYTTVKNVSIEVSNPFSFVSLEGSNIKYHIPVCPWHHIIYE